MSVTVAQKPPQMCFLERNHKIQTLATNRSQQSFTKALAWGARIGVRRTFKPTFDDVIMAKITANLQRDQIAAPQVASAFLNGGGP